MMFFLSFAGFVSPSITGLGALATGIIRKGGMPRFSMDYA